MLLDAARLRRRRARGLDITVGASTPAAAQIAAMQHDNHGGQLRAGEWLQGHHLLRGALPGGARQRLRHAQHDRVRRRPVRRHGGERQEALHVLQPILLRLLRRRARRADSGGLGADALRDGRRVRLVGGCHGHRTHQPGVRRGVVPE
uniref:Uncharacterized protein n=1 Tax=Arundo donax TaxID=35708 RepID=A0A0A9HMN3_ARUDO